MPQEGGGLIPLRCTSSSQLELDLEISYCCSQSSAQIRPTPLLGSDNFFTSQFHRPTYVGIVLLGVPQHVRHARWRGRRSQRLHVARRMRIYGIDHVNHSRHSKEYIPSKVHNYKTCNFKRLPDLQTCKFKAEDPIQPKINNIKSPSLDSVAV
jgi:hypothetical protein